MPPVDDEELPPLLEELEELDELLFDPLDEAGAGSSATQARKAAVQSVKRIPLV
jgi:hypothetical protein